MPNVADELAALRAKGSVKAHATNLKTKGGATLSTPEAEAAAIKAKRDNDKLGNVKATEILTKGSSAGGYSREIEHTLNQTGKKKADWKKKNESRKILSKGASGGVASVSGGSPGTVEGGTKVAATRGEPAPVEDDTAPAPTSAPEDKEEAASAPAETSNDDDDDVPDLEEAGDDITELETSQTQQSEQAAAAAGGEDAQERQITNRNEKKARKMMTRLGMRPVSNIARVTLKAGGGRGYFFIDRPDVFTNVGGRVDTYVIFGEAKQRGTGGSGGGGAASAQAQAAMAQQQAAMAATAGGKGGAEMPSVVEEDDEDVPELGGEDGVEAKDIDLVMSQASCSRAKAVAALKENDGDLVNAIMSLTT
eukprot:CAMPEP_0181102118 /NCGR_PEP_ID=MMETSP1071-20121207/14136_1 /TAXON_ID=35127 /ORGANISM="Thalassiosira sp., Strain NH16" /LENGTH=364 /DNA_ID=CAMNT_0023185053 /DNA_START=56 /DNA_END=1150 /DNA_ORIENTATION=+